MEAQHQTTGRGEYLARVARMSDLGAEYKSMVLELEAEGGAAMAAVAPGQFIQIACRRPGDHLTAGPFLRRPFSIASLSPVTDTTCEVEVIHNVIGPGTYWLGARRVGDHVSVLGPLGKGFVLPDQPVNKCLLLGGGIGIPPLIFLANHLFQAGRRQILAFAGMRSVSNFENSICRDDLDPDNPLRPAMLLEQFTQSETPSIIATDDGSFGFAGTAVAAVEKFLDGNPEWGDAHLFACGPSAMLKATAKLALGRQLPCQVCMEEYMACGFGVCQSCVAPTWVDSATADASPTNLKYELVCDAGPVFEATRIRWDLV